MQLLMLLEKNAIGAQDKTDDIRTRDKTDGISHNGIKHRGENCDGGNGLNHDGNRHRHDQENCIPDRETTRE